MKELFANKWVKFGLVTFIFLLFVVWLKSWWMVIGVAVIYDLYISQKVHWAFWKKKGVEKQTKTVEWIDSIIFAAVAAIIIKLFFIQAFSPHSSPRQAHSRSHRRR